MAIDESVQQQLVEAARAARENAYAPYSKYLVGAAALGGSGKIYSGCNVENASYGLTNCAERTAIFKAVSEGEKSIQAIACILDNPEGYGVPCGACRQVIREWGVDVPVIMANLQGQVKVMTIGELLPLSFGPENLDL